MMEVSMFEVIKFISDNSALALTILLILLCTLLGITYFIYTKLHPNSAKLLANILDYTSKFAQIIGITFTVAFGSLALKAYELKVAEDNVSTLRNEANILSTLMDLYRTKITTLSAQYERDVKGYEENLATYVTQESGYQKTIESQNAEINKKYSQLIELSNKLSQAQTSSKKFEQQARIQEKIASHSESNLYLELAYYEARYRLEEILSWNIEDAFYVKDGGNHLPYFEGAPTTLKELIRGVLVDQKTGSTQFSSHKNTIIDTMLSALEAEAMPVGLSVSITKAKRDCILILGDGYHENFISGDPRSGNMCTSTKILETSIKNRYIGHLENFYNKCKKIFDSKI